MMNPLLRLQNVSLTFSRGRRHYVRALAEVSLDVYEGELVSVHAPRAQGKTTLLHVAAGSDRPDDGHVEFDGMDLWRLSDRRRSELLAGDIALVEHRRPELDLAARELVALPLMRMHGRRRADELAEEVLARVGIAECGAQRWRSLADSERALLTLARGVACKPRLLLADDLMSVLGLGSTEDVGRMLHGLARERQMAVLMTVSHTNSTVWCDRVASLAGGKLVVPPASPLGPDGNVIEFPGSGPRLRA